MSLQTLTASGFGEDWDGTYVYQYQKDKWKNGDYWIFRNSYYYMISSSEYLFFEEEHLKARMALPMDNNAPIDDPTGNYNGVNGEPNGSVS